MSTVAGLDAIHGPGSLQLQVSFEALIVSLVTPLVGAGIPSADLREALRRLVENQEAWEAIDDILLCAIGVAEEAEARAHVRAVVRAGDPPNPERGQA